MEIKHPRRLLIVSSPGCDVAGLVKGRSTLAEPLGMMHDLTLSRSDGIRTDYQHGRIARRNDT